MVRLQRWRLKSTPSRVYTRSTNRLQIKLIWFWNGCPSEMQQCVFVFKIFKMFLMTSCDFKLSLDCLACVMMRFHVSFKRRHQSLHVFLFFAKFSSEETMCPTASVKDVHLVRLQIANGVRSDLSTTPPRTARCSPTCVMTNLALALDGDFQERIARHVLHSGVGFA